MFRKPRLRGASKYLAPGEQVLLTTRRHPVVLVKPLAIWLATLFVLGSISMVITESNPIVFVDRAVLWLSLAVTAYTIVPGLIWWKSSYVVTDERVLLLQGLLSVNVSSVRLARVTETSFNRSVLGRILGYGDLKLDAAGEQLSLATLSRLPRAGEVYRLVTSLLLGEPDSEPRHLDPGEETTGPLPQVKL